MDAISGALQRITGFFAAQRHSVMPDGERGCCCAAFDPVRIGPFTAIVPIRWQGTEIGSCRSGVSLSPRRRRMRGTPSSSPF
jgi:hypothetical protein